MCFGKRQTGHESPRSSSPQESSTLREPGPRRARSSPQVSQQRAPRNPPRPNYPGTRARGGRSMLTAPPLSAAGYSPQTPLLPGQQASTPDPDRGIVIAVMGVTGAGKSYFIREVTGNPEVKVSSGLYSYTSKVQSYSFEYAGVKVTLVDTPGFNDTQKSETEVLQEIANWTSATYRKKQLLSGIIYLHPITHTRMEGSAMKSLRMFQSLCGQEVLENVLLTTTQWSNVNPAEAELRENKLRNPDFWGGLIGKGATLQRFHGTRESGLELIHSLMSNKQKPLHIQDQIVKQHMTLLETDAGKFISGELAAQEKRYRRELESLERQLREAIKAKDDEMNQILAVEQARAQEKLGKAAAEQKLLEKLHAADIEKRKLKRRGDRRR